MQIGPPRPLPGGETPGMLRQRLKTLLADQFPSETPFTIQRLAELLLEPHKQYSRLDKLVQSLFESIVAGIKLIEHWPTKLSYKERNLQSARSISCVGCCLGKAAVCHIIAAARP